MVLQRTLPGSPHLEKSKNISSKVRPKPPKRKTEKHPKQNVLSIPRGP